MPGRFSLTLWTIYVILFMTVLYWLSSLELLILRKPAGMLIPLAALAAVWRLRSRLTASETEPLLFEDGPDPRCGS